MKKTKSLAEMRKEFGGKDDDKKTGSEKVPPKITPPEPVKDPPESGDPPGGARKVPPKKVGRPPAPPKPELMGKPGVEALVKTPFVLGQVFTGYDGFKMNPLLEEEINKLAYQVYLDFGEKYFDKWANLICLGLLLGGNYTACVMGYFDHVKNKKEVKPPEEKKDDKK